MRIIILKIFYKCCHLIGFPKYLPIQSGPLRGYKISTVISDTRYFIGDYESDAAALFNTNLKNTDIVLDIGANVGYFSMLFAKICDKGQVYAIEASKKTFGYLSNIIHKNSFQNVTVNNCGIHKETKVLAFSDNENTAANTFEQESSIFKSSNKIEVQCYSLDDFVKKQNITKIDFIKIDVEGAEYEVLLGATATLKKIQPKILLATHDCHVKGVKEKCLNLLTNYGYNYQSTGESKEIEGQEDFICEIKRMV